MNKLSLILKKIVYSSGDTILGDQFVDGALTVLGLALDFVLGVSFVKDLGYIVTGYDIKGERISDTDRVVLAATLLVPSALSGSAKLVGKSAKSLKSLIYKGKGKGKGGFYDDLLEAIKRSDDELATFSDNPCIGLSGLALAAMNAGADPRRKLGEITDEFIGDHNYFDAKPDIHNPGSKGNWSKELNKPKPDTTYPVGNATLRLTTFLER